PAAADAAPVAAERWVHNPVGPFPDLQGLPMPDYALFDTARITANKGGWFGLMTSRGCPYRCTYCLNHEVVDRYRAELGRPTKDLGFFRFRRPEQMLEEIRHVLATYPNVGTFILDDDLFTLDTEHALAFCAAYRAAGIGVPFVVNSHVKRLEDRVAAALAGAGCRILKLGIESGSERVRARILDRHMRDDDMLATIATAERHGLHTSGFVMVGLPGETRAERFETVEFLARSGLGRFRVSRFFPFPGTRSYQLAVEGGYVDRSRMATLTDFTESSCLDFGPEENRLVDQLATALPWFVDARLGGAVAERYRPLVELLLAQDDAEWAAFKPRVRAVDAE
ncbi:MAG TPA: radical SAM protein, partial [Planctomycetota bacterium]|nr:radical SAM protein [Planctomycetota bacterium]